MRDGVKLSGMKELHEAETALCNGEGQLKDRLMIAAQKFWQAQFYRSLWPESLQERADLLNWPLLQRGGIPVTVSQMDDQTVVIVSGEIVEFVEAAEEILEATRCGR